MTIERAIRTCEQGWPHRSYLTRLLRAMKLFAGIVFRDWYGSRIMPPAAWLCAWDVIWKNCPCAKCYKGGHQ